jgi:hypothetical protein
MKFNRTSYHEILSLYLGKLSSVYSRYVLTHVLKCSSIYGSVDNYMLYSDYCSIN